MEDNDYLAGKDGAPYWGDTYIKSEGYDKMTGNYAVAPNISATSQAFKVNVTCGPLRFFHNRRRALRRNRHK